MDYISELWTSRTPQEFVAAQSDIVRESVEIALEGSRRIADLSLKVAEETGKQIK
ncbi:phasin family protein [Bradyrhizobium elkanii]